MAKIGGKRGARHYIREWIEARGLDQKRVAERMECEPATVSKLLKPKGGMKMTLDWLSRFADALNVAPEDLLRDPTRPTADELLRALSEPDQRRAIDFIEGLKRTG